MHKPLVLIIEDDKAIRNLLSTALEIHGYQCRSADTGWLGLQKAISYHPDVIILDLGLPDMDGIDIIKKIRSWSTVPLITVSARSEDKDKIDCLDAGADDYLPKPFSVDELLARLRAALRRVQQYSAPPGEEKQVFVNGRLTINYPAGYATLDDKEIHLTPIEYKLLCLLAKNVGKVLTYNYIIKEIWGSFVPDDTPNLRVFMATLRKKIEGSTTASQLFQTHVGVGYRMVRITDEQ